MRATCSLTQCPKISSTEDFELESVGIPFTCCPKPKYKSCIHEDKTYKVFIIHIRYKYVYSKDFITNFDCSLKIFFIKINETWTSVENPCESYTCALNADETLEKQKNTKDCNSDCKQVKLLLMIKNTYNIFLYL